MSKPKKILRKDVSDSLCKKMRGMYVRGDTTYGKLSKQFNVSHDAIKALGKKQRWVRLKAEHNEGKLRSHKAALMKERLNSAAEDADVRVRYAKAAKDVMAAAMDKLKTQVSDQGKSIYHLNMIAATIRRCQEIEFIARGMPSEIARVESTHKGWNAFLVHVRQERGLPDREIPFAAPEEGDAS